MVVVVVVGRGGGMVRGSRSVSRLLVDLGLQDHRHGADLVQGSHEQAGEQAGQGRDKENSAEPSHFFCRPAQWQGKALEWRVSRTDKRRVGEEFGHKVTSRWSTYHSKKNRPYNKTTQY